jgi:anti-anti-sigma regulatory factor
MADGSLGTAKPEQLGPSLWVLNLVGEHDLLHGTAYRPAFRPIHASGTTVVDLSEASFVDSTVVNSLTQRARDSETLLLVAPKNSAVRRTLDLVGITNLLSTFETREEALRAVPPGDNP